MPAPPAITKLSVCNIVFDRVPPNEWSSVAVGNDLRPSDRGVRKYRGSDPEAWDRGGGVCRRFAAILRGRSNDCYMTLSGIKPAHSLRVVYLGGPGDAPAVLRSMAADKPYVDVPHVPYSGQVFEVCREMGVPLLSVSTHGRLDDFTLGDIRAVNRPDPQKGKSGLAFHWANVTLAQELRRDVAEFNANLVITSPSPYPFLIQGLAARGVHLVPALHAILWPEFTRPSRLRRLMVQLSQRFYSSTCTAILSHPGSTVQQVNELTAGHARPIVEFLPLFRGDLFAGVAPPDPEAPVLRVMTVGRVEPEKGVFVLIEVAQRLKAAGKVKAHFDVCGAGSALEEARRRVVTLGLQDWVILHGWTEMELMQDLWGRSHVALIPTTSDFVEGFNQVVIEAVIAGRPVITSRVCPALDYVRPCAIEVDVDDVDGYTQAVTALATDRARYRDLQSKTARVAQPFLDPEKSFAAGLKRVMLAIRDGHPVEPVQYPPALLTV